MLQYTEDYFQQTSEYSKELYADEANFLRHSTVRRPGAEYQVSR